jgi:hypothetical protein
MKSTIKFLPILVIALVLLGCSFTVNVPTVDTSSTQTFNISQPITDGMRSANVSIEMGGGRLTLAGGSSQLIEGNVVYNVPDWKPTLSLNDNNLLISQTHTSNVGIPSNDIKNDWNLQLGKVPTSLEVSAGAYEGTLDLSGIPLTDLEINDGASKATVEFTSENPQEMQRFVYKTGASDVSLIGLGYANTQQVEFNSGAGNYTLDFTGNMSKDMSVKISSGLSQVKIIVPKNVHTRVNLDGGLSNVDTQGTWLVNGTQYEVNGGDINLTINIEMAVGNLVLAQQ